jgi:hypothetical protein
MQNLFAVILRLATYETKLLEFKQTSNEEYNPTKN